MGALKTVPTVPSPSLADLSLDIMDYFQDNITRPETGLPHVDKEVSDKFRAFPNHFPSLFSGSLEVDENHTGPHTGFPCDVHPDHLHSDGQDASYKSQAMSLLF